MGSRSTDEERLPSQIVALKMLLLPDFCCYFLGTLALRVHSCTLFCLILSLDFSKGVMGRLIRRAMVVWWFIKGLSSSLLIYISILLLINLQNHYHCPSLQMGRPEGFLALQGVTAPPYGLFFRRFIHISMGKSFNCFVYIVVMLHIDFIVFLLLILSGDVELNPVKVCNMYALV